MLPLAGLLAGEEGGAHRLGSRERGQLVGKDGPDEPRPRVIGARLDRGQTRQGLDDWIVGGPFNEGSALPEAGDGDIDHRGCDLADFGLGYAEPLHHAGAKVLDEHVRARRQLQEGRAALGLLDVQGEGAFAAVEVDEAGRQPAPSVAERSGVVAGSGHLHLDDVRALVAQHAGSPGPGQHRGEVDYPVSGERSRHRCVSRRNLVAASLAPGAVPNPRCLFGAGLMLSIRVGELLVHGSRTVHPNRAWRGFLGTDYRKGVDRAKRGVANCRQARRDLVALSVGRRFRRCSPGPPSVPAGWARSAADPRFCECTPRWRDNLLS